MAGILFPDEKEAFFKSDDGQQQTQSVAEEAQAPKQEQQPQVTEQSRPTTAEPVVETQSEEPQKDPNWMFKELEAEAKQRDEAEKPAPSQYSQGVPAESDGGEVTPQETETVGLMWEMMEDEFKFPRLSNEYRPRSFDDFARMTRAIVDANKSPKYSHPEVENFDKFVASGGDPYQYMRNSGEISYENLQLTDDYSRQMIIADHMRIQGFPDETIRKTVDGYTKSGTLADVANDSLRMLQQMSQQQKQMMVQQQQQADAAYQQQVRENVNRTVEYIERSPDILGAKLSRRDKDELMLYMYQEDKNGQTRFAKDLTMNEGNLVKAAYVLMKGQQAFAQAEARAQMTARDKLRSKIAQDNIRQHIPGAKARKQQSGSRVPMWELVD